MKIMMAHKYMFRGGGTSTYVFGLADELERRGHTWVPFTVGYDETAVDTYTDYFVSPPLGPDQSHYEDMKLSPLAMLKLLARATYSLEARRKAAALIDAVHPDIAYIHNVYNYMSPSVLDACAGRGLPIVMRVPDYNMMCAELHFLRHGDVCTECLRGGYWRALQHRCLKGSLAATAARVASMYVHKWLHLYEKVHLFITPSSFMREKLIQAGYGAQRIVHLRSFYPRQVEDEGDRVEDDYILYFGRVAPEKAVDTLIRALARLEDPPRLVVAGSDVDGTRSELEDLCRELSLTDKVNFVGFQDRQALDELIRRCLFTVVPSRWYDNCPMAVLESFAHGKPVVASDIGGIPEQVAGGCGILFEPDNEKELAASMTRLLGDARLRHSMGDAALQRLREQYSTRAHCDRLLELFEELITERCVT
ncbi:MAG: glycosyltransferase family 4 protein [Armatimonadota bacterium]